ncbi:MAG TPA: hypothetical protein PKI19_04275 [Elusimicrobiales bacterium]|nr:hypothetical protein [Elusimicrobiales bacterium]
MIRKLTDAAGKAAARRQNGEKNPRTGVKDIKYKYVFTIEHGKGICAVCFG